REVGTHHFIAYGYQGADSAGFPRTLVDDPGCKNGHPRFRYSCTHANGSAYEPVKMGCEPQPGVVPGISWAEGEALDVSPLETHARPCGLDGVNCAGYGTGRCVEANLVFGPLSDDDMCILPGALYDPLPGAPPEQACNPYSCCAPPGSPPPCWSLCSLPPPPPGSTGISSCPRSRAARGRRPASRRGTTRA